MKHFLLAVALTCFGGQAFGYGGSVSGTRTGQAQVGTANTVVKYQSNGQTGNSSISDDGTNLTSADGLTIGSAGTGNSLGTGNGSAPKVLTVVGTLSTKPVQFGTNETATQGIYVSSVVPVTSSYVVLVSSGKGGSIMTATPAVSTFTVLGTGTAIADGTFLVLTTTAAETIVLQDNDQLSGSLLELGASTRTLSAKKVLILMFQKTLGEWLEIFYGNN